MRWRLAVLLAAVAPAVAEQVHFDNWDTTLASTSHAGISTHPALDSTDTTLNHDNFRETLMSVLSASDQHGTFIHLLQRSKLVPMLSKLNGTVFAPTDAAWKEWEKTHMPTLPTSRTHGWLGPEGLAEWAVDERVAQDQLEARIADSPDDAEMLRTEMDNQHWALRQHLLYHMLNHTISVDEWAPSARSNVTVLTTLLFPVSEEPPPSPIPQPGTPWLPGNGVGMLGKHGQRLRLGLPLSEEGGERGRVGMDYKGIGGATVWDGAGWNTTNLTSLDTDLKNKDKDKTKAPVGVKWAHNGLVVGIESVLDPPGDILEVIRSTPELSYLARLIDTADPLPKPLPPQIASTDQVTLFAASDKAFAERFDSIDRGYLEGGFGVEGLSRVLSPSFVIGNGKRHDVGWVDSFRKKPENVSATSGTLVVEAPGNGSLIVNGTEAEAVDIFAANGVIHIMPEVLLPEGFELLNAAEKVLLTRNATRFVSLMRSANLSSKYIGDPGETTSNEYTILAPTDDAIEYMEWWSGLVVPETPVLDLFVHPGKTNNEVNLPAPIVVDDSPLAELLKYHIVSGRFPPKTLEDGMLLGSELKLASLDGERQMLEVEVSESRDPEANWDVQDGEIRFGGAMSIGPPVKSGNSVLYFISSILAPPLDVLQTAVGDLQLSTYIAAVYAAGLERSVKKNPSMTYFIPHNRAFDTMGLAMKYLLLPEGRDELRKVLRYHSVNKLVYTPDQETGSTVIKTMEGGNIVLERGENNTFSLRSPTKWPGHDSGGTLPSNGELRPAKMKKKNALAETGVIHILDSVVLPSDVDITIAKLVHGSKERTMAELMVRAGLGWILEGREPTDDEVSRAGLEGFVCTTKSNDTDDEDKDPFLAMPSYTVLVPTDNAWSRLNLTYYLSEPEALLSLLKLHIIPSKLTSGSFTDKERPSPRDGQPLGLQDDIVYPTLLSPTSRYGQLAFRAWGGGDYLIGVRGARGNDKAARTGSSGRASVRWKRARRGVGMFSDSELKDDGLWRGGMTLGGGVVMIDAVLVPFDPSWWERFGWLVLTITGATAVVSLLGVSVWWWWSTTKRKKEGYERVAAEEDDREREEANRHWRRHSRSGSNGRPVGVHGNGAAVEEEAVE